MTISDAREIHGDHSERQAALAGMAGAFAAFAGLTLLAAARNGWAFEYPLDDVYIHLAMAEQIADGGYGINAGEAASASSSPLYPFLLAPLADTPVQRWLPLAWNLVALAVASGLFGLALVWAGLGRAAVFLAALGPLALATYVTAFTGMENMIHVAASLAVVLGLWRFLTTGRIGGLLVAGIAFAPAIRFEGIALALAASGLVVLSGRARSGVALALLALAPLLIFAGLLSMHGMEPLPNSVMAKLGDTGAGGPFSRFLTNSATYGGRFLLGLSLVLFLIGLATLNRDRPTGLFALAVASAGLAHLLFGSVGWMDRYETYATVSLVAALALALRHAAFAVRATAVTVALLAGAVTYGPYALSVYAWNPAAISAQHGEMSRLAKDFVRAPVAVNDIGYVAWRNPHYVLDLWGLASPRALEVRTGDPGQGWAGPLAEDRGVILAMIYDAWLGDAVPEDWHPLGTLHLDVPNAFLGGAEVAFYATDASASDELRAAIAEWRKDLHERARFEPAEAEK